MSGFVADTFFYSFEQYYKVGIIMLFRLLLIFFLFYLVLRFFSRLFRPRAENKSNFEQREKSKEGETTIRFNKKGEKIVDKDKGEYVDFEEIDEKD